MYVSCSFSFSLLFNFFEVVTNNSQEIRLVIQIFSLKLLVECGDYILNFIYLLLKQHLFFFTHKANLFSSLWFISKRSLISTFNISANSTNCNTDGCILFERQRDMVTSDRFIFVAKSLLVKHLSAIKTRNQIGLSRSVSARSLCHVIYDFIYASKLPLLFYTLVIL